MKHNYDVAIAIVAFNNCKMKQKGLGKRVNIIELEAIFMRNQSAKSRRGKFTLKEKYISSRKVHESYMWL